MLPSNHLDHLSTLLPSIALEASCPLAAAPPGLVAPTTASWPLGPNSSTSCSCRSCPACLTASNRNINRAISAKLTAPPAYRDVVLLGRPRRDAEKSSWKKKRGFR